MGGCFSSKKHSTASYYDNDTPYYYYNDTTTTTTTTDTRPRLNNPPASATVIIHHHRKKEEKPNPIKKEEHDVYAIHRKDAIKMRESASKHAKAAKEAFARGDHVAGQRSKLKAKEKKEAVKRLDAVAAKKILNDKNCNNDLWKLDLHGLHVTEAKQALEERLNHIESTYQSSKNLLVITGKGIHSQGKAKLPGAIRGFLNGKGYTFDGSKPGVITVQPKF